ncbi:MAG TPA: glycosyltransferase family 4 protein [Pyrinomonadaceae bacterium]|jgi:glycosyltransferase involved in cell wall biosynthesis
MRILSISNCHLLEYQGSGYAILHFSQGLRDRGHEVDLFGPDSFMPFPSLRKARSYQQALGMVYFTLRQLSNKQYDVVEFYGAQSWLIISLLRRMPRRKFLVVSHSNGLETHYNTLRVRHFGSTSLDGKPSKWYQVNQTPLFERAFTQADGLVTVSEFDHSYAMKNGYQDNSRIITIEYGLRNDYLGLRAKLDRKPVIGYCGRWEAGKGTNIIYKDITQILVDFPDCSFKLIGVGKDFTKESVFPASLCSRIDVIPFVENKQKLQDIYQSISILVVPSIYESFGLVTAEAMACGCAVVASRTGFAFNLKNGEEAMLLDEPRSPHLYNAVEQLLKDEPLRLRIAQGGYIRVQNLRWDIAVKRLEDTYHRWLDELRQSRQSADSVRQIIDPKSANL